MKKNTALRKSFWIITTFTGLFALALLIYFNSLAHLFSQYASYTHTQLQTGNLTAWQTFDGDAARTGTNTQETTLTAQNVSQLQQFWQITLTSKVDSAPVYQPNVITPSGTYNLLFVNTTAGTLVAIDADSGGIVWQATHKKLNMTTSTPVIDPSGQYIYSYALDGKVHKYAIGTGVEIVDLIFPVTITLIPQVEKAGSSITLANGFMYVTTATFPWLEGLSTTHYNGHVVVINLTTGATNVLNTECSNMHELLTNASSSANYCPYSFGGVWSRAGVIVDPATTNFFVVSANGLFDANTGGVNYADSIREFSQDGTHLIDSYTPSDYATLQANDLDLGITSPVLLPSQAGSTTPSLLVLGGKEKVLRLINKQNMSGLSGPNHVGGELQTVKLTKGCIMFPQPVSYVDPTGQTWVFAAYGCQLYAYKVITNLGKTSLQLVYQNAALGGSSPIIANNMLFIEGKTSIHVIDPTTGTVLWTTPNPGGLHWQSLIVVNGRIYVPDNAGHVTSFALASQMPTAPVMKTQPQQGSQPLVSDTFQRPDQSLWGVSSAGNQWGGQANSSNQFQISNNTGVISGSGEYTAILGAAEANTTVQAQAIITNFSQGKIGVLARYIDTNTWYSAVLDGTKFIIEKKVNGVITPIAATPYHSDPNVLYNIKLQVQGSLLSANVWQDGDSEPSQWMVTGTDTAIAHGSSGLRVVLSHAVAAVTSFSVTKQ